MNATEIKTNLDALCALISEKGFLRPEADLRISDGGQYGSAAVLILEGRVTQEYDTKWNEYISLGDIDADTGDVEAIPLLFREAQRRINARPTPEEEQVNQFRRDLGSLLSTAKSLGLNSAAVEATVNPLTEMMKQLSENVLTDQRPVAAE